MLARRTKRFGRRLLLRTLQPYYWAVLRRLKANDTCVLLGSGPSIDRLVCQHAFLDTKDIISCNFVCMNDRVSELDVRFNCIVDRGYSKSMPDAYWRLGLPTVASTKNFQEFNGFRPDTRFTILATRPFEKGADLNQTVRTGNVMPFMIQVAVRLGYRKIYLCGVDHFPKDDIKSNSFKGYIGRTFKKTLDHQKLLYIEDFYQAAADWSASKGVGLVNTTPGSHLTIIDRQEIPGLYAEPDRTETSTSLL